MKKIFLLGILAVVLLTLIGYAIWIWNKKLGNRPELRVEILSSPSPSPKAVTLGFAGEIILARDVASKINQHGDYKYPFLKVANLTRSQDLFFATLEAPLLGKNIPCGKECMKFIADEQAVNGLVFAGIDVVSLAANHIMDGGEIGLNKTLEVLDKNDIAHAGAGLTVEQAQKPVIKEINGNKIGFLAYNEIYPHGNTASSQNLTQNISQLKKNSDLVIVAFHWGEEYTLHPSVSQKELAHQAIEAGASVIIGDHPHWVQTIEFFQGKPIFYSVGNFVFDQMWSTETRQGIMVFLTFRERQLVRLKILPFQIEDYSQPQFLNEQKARVVMERIFSVSDPASINILRSLE